MKKRHVIGNWKRYVETPEAAKDLAKKLRKRASEFKNVEIAVAPAYPFIPLVAEALKGTTMRTGAQAASPFTGGAHTGEVSALMLKKIGATFSIVGHSERRAAGEADGHVREELAMTLEAGLKAILCVGESSRDAESGSHFSVIAHQLTSALADLPKSALLRLTIAYEPVWAIGKSATDAMKGAELRETVIFIRKTLADLVSRETALKIPIVYGGSVEPSNAYALVAEGDINGFLVGHESAKFDDFMEILKACATK